MNRTKTDATLKKAGRVGLPPRQGIEMGRGWGRAEGWKQETKERLNVCDMLPILTLLTKFRCFGVFGSFTYIEYLKVIHY